MIDKNIHILLIEDEEYDVNRVKRTLRPFEDRLIINKVVADGQTALEFIRANNNLIDVVIMDFQIAGGISGEALIKAIKEIDSAIQIIVITKMTINVSDFDFADALIQAGAMWYCTKYPGDIEDFIYQPTDFILSIINAYHKRQLEIKEKKSSSKLSNNVEEILDKYKIIGSSKAIQTLKSKIERAAGQEATVLITGESGTGKELVARHVHYRSKRKFEKFVTINSGGIPNDLIESELFGFEKGSFTGANYSKAGLFEIADNGSIFLDEIAELPLAAQVKLLRVLQEGEIDKIGRTEKLNINIRIIAATNKNLKNQIKAKSFRDDLFYRLNVFTIDIPPLRQRLSDLPELVDYFLYRYCSEISAPVPTLTNEAMACLGKQDWPGNVRQLQNVLQRLLFVAEKNIDAADIENALGNVKPADTMEEIFHLSDDKDDILPWREMEKKVKYRYFNFVRQTSRSDSEAARILGLAPPNYYRMCKELGLK